MHLLYPSAPDRSNAVDELFAEEYDAARSAGLACSLFCDEELESGRFRARPEFPANTQVLYRGWMLTPENYARLHGAILVAGGRPLTSPQQYRHCHYLQEWYPLCEDLTPATLFLSRNADFEAVLAQSPWRAWFVKDHVKSLTTQRGSKATNAAEVREVLDSIERYRGTIEGGVCLREFEALRAETEERYFVLHGRAHGRLDTVPPLVEQVAQRIDCPFFSVDVVESTSGELRLMELGDGQVSDRKQWPAARFAAMLAQA